MKHIFLPLGLALAVMGVDVRAEDWPRWRGPNLNGISGEKGWSSNWSAAGPRVLWKANVGLGNSSFVVASGRAYTQGNKNNQDIIYCFDAASGRELWKHSYPEDKGARAYQGGTNATPTVDGQAVYTVSKSGLVHCLDAAKGTVSWKANVLQLVGSKPPSWGIGSSPLVLGNLLILNAGPSGVALDKRTGRLVWGNRGSDLAGYATPTPYRTGNAIALAIFNQNGAVGVNAANGQVLWKYPWKTRYDVNAADLIISGQTLFLSSGYGTGAALVQFTANGFKSVWQHKDLRAQFNTPVLINGHLYGIDDNARRFTLKCVELATGRVKWKGDNISAVTAADGKLICQGETGELFIVAADPSAYKKLAEARPFRTVSWATPVLANGRIYCRGGDGQVVCLDVTGK
tara:strand:- start:1673 stop:2878 length:1206 start_codon:yes stop_codon:yes gene_type:complete